MYQGRGRYIKMLDMDPADWDRSGGKVARENAKARARANAGYLSEESALSRLASAPCAHCGSPLIPTRDETINTSRVQNKKTHNKCSYQFQLRRARERAADIRKIIAGAVSFQPVEWEES